MAWLVLVSRCRVRLGAPCGMVWIAELGSSLVGSGGFRSVEVSPAVRIDYAGFAHGKVGLGMVGPADC